MDKQAIRKQMKQARLDLFDEEYIEKSNLIINALKEHEFFKTAKTIGIYVSFNKEVETISFIKEILKNKKVCIPKIENKNMEFYKIDTLQDTKRSSFGILEPITKTIMNKQEIDVLIVPMLAYTKDNYRVGYGGGYYDYYLQGYLGKTIGIAFSFQEIDTFTIEKHDLPLDCIINENS